MVRIYPPPANLESLGDVLIIMPLCARTPHAIKLKALEFKKSLDDTGNRRLKMTPNRDKFKESVFSITDTEPTPLLRDFTTFLQYFNEHHVALTKTNEFIPRKDLFEINKEMTHPTPGTSARTIQPIYIQLHFFYHLALAGKLFQKTARGNQEAFEPTGRLQAYEELKPAEKFFFLLETFWMDADWDIIGSGSGFPPSRYVSDVLALLGQQKPGMKILLQGGAWNDTKPEIAMLLFSWDYFLIYFSLFGFWKVVPDKEVMDRSEYRREFIAQAITPSAFGIQLARKLSQNRDIYQWNKPLRQLLGPSYSKNKKRKQGSSDDGLQAEPFLLPFQSLFLPGELQRTFPRGSRAFRDGIYVFKAVVAPKKSRRIELGATKSLLDLHLAIQDALNFDDDHLFSFYHGRASLVQKPLQR